MTFNEYFRDWIKVVNQSEINKVLSNLRGRKSAITPAYQDIFKAFTLCNLDDLKVVVLGQDPYPQLNVATGIAFGNKKETTSISSSLEVIKEAVINPTSIMSSYDFDITLESWGRQGVLLLNSALTTNVGEPKSHIQAWRPFTSSLLKNLSKYHTGIVYALLGNTAQTFEPYINSKYNHIIKVAHPSYYVRTQQSMPNIFKDINDILVAKYGTKINWFEYE